MSHRDKHHTHTALMLLACAFAFVYLLAWQFQWSDIVRRWNGTPRQILIQDTTSTPALPARLESINEKSGTTMNLWKVTKIKDPEQQWVLEKEQTPKSGTIVSPWERADSWTPDISFTSLNAVPQSFMRLWISSPAGIMMDTQRVIITSNTNTIKRAWESNTVTSDQIKQIWLNVDSLTFYNDSTWVNILVLMEITHNNQPLLIQAPYAVYRDDKAHLNSLIAQLTQK